MPEITAELVKKLRDATNVSMMECKRALTETGGDMEKATKLLREKGMAVAVKRAGKATNQGVIVSATTADGKTAALVEVNCETDFVARNEGFRAFAQKMAVKALATDAPLAESVKDELAAKLVEIGENILVRRNVRIAVPGAGAVGSYIHLGGKIGVLVDLGCTKAETVANPLFRELLSDLTLHVAACNPQHLTSADVPASVIASEREIYAKQVVGKPPQIVEKIVDGKMRKFYEDTCFVNQVFVKEQKTSITALLAEKGKALGDTLTIRRFVRYQLGE